jgi:hypothetical protein
MKKYSEIISKNDFFFVNLEIGTAEQLIAVYKKEP